MSEGFDVGWFDLSIVVAYIIVSRTAAIWLTRGGQGDSEGFFLGGRSFLWPVIGFSLFASNVGGTTFVGLAGSGYDNGIAVYSYEWMAAVVLVLFVLFVLPFYLRSKVYTMPEFLERRYDRKCRSFYAGFLLLLNIFLDCASALYAGALVIQTIYPPVDLWMGVTLLAVLSAILSITGGLGAVVVSDTIQASVLYIGAICVSVAAFFAIPSWQAVQDSAPEAGLHLIQPASDDNLPWPGLITGVFVIGLYFWITNQFIVQRALGAKTLDHGRWGALLAGLLKLPVLFLMVLPGTMALALYPDLETPDLAFPTLAFDLLPVGLRGVVLAALIAAIASTIDSILNSASTLMTMDLVRQARPDTPDRRLVVIGRVTTAIVTLVAVLWAPQIANFPTIWEYFQSVLSYLAPPIVIVFLAAIFWPRANAAGASVTLIGGIVVGFAAFLAIEVGEVIELQFLYACGIATLLSAAAIVAVSLATAPPDMERTREMSWSLDLWHAETEELKGKPAWQNYRYQSVALLALTAAIVAWWW